MKLLLDENISRRILPTLEPHFPASTHVCLAGLERASDDESWQFANTNHYSIVTCDSDFHELSVLRGSPPKLIWLQSGNMSNREVADLIVTARSHIAAALENENIHFVELS